MKKKGKPSLNVVATIALLVLFCVFLGVVVLWEGDRAELPGKTETQASTESETTDVTETIPPTTLPPETTLPSYAPRRINFLLIGRDWHDEGENSRSDAMILCSFDTGAKTVTMLSFLRDIYLKIPGYGSNRLNASYSWGGYELLNETLEENFGVQIDVNLEIDFDGFEAVIDDLGGVDIELTDREASYLNQNYEWELTEGMHCLTGEQALAYSRIRYLDSDFVRTQRQRNVLTALMGKYRTAPLQEVLNATDAFLDESASDHTDEELLSYVWELYPLLADCEVISQQIPADGTYSYETIRGMSVIEVDFEENREQINALIGLEAG